MVSSLLENGRGKCAMGRRKVKRGQSLPAPSKPINERSTRCTVVRFVTVRSSVSTRAKTSSYECSLPNSSTSGTKRTAIGQLGDSEADNGQFEHCWKRSSVHGGNFAGGGAGGTTCRLSSRPSGNFR